MLDILLHSANSVVHECLDVVGKMAVQVHGDEKLTIKFKWKSLLCTWKHCWILSYKATFLFVELWTKQQIQSGPSVNS